MRGRKHHWFSDHLSYRVQMSLQWHSKYDGPHGPVNLTFEIIIECSEYDEILIDRQQYLKSLLQINPIPDFSESIYIWNSVPNHFKKMWLFYLRTLSLNPGLQRVPVHKKTHFQTNQISNFHHIRLQFNWKLVMSIKLGLL